MESRRRRGPPRRRSGFLPGEALRLESETMRLSFLRGILVALALLALAIVIGLWRAPSFARVALERAAHARGLAASFDELHVGWGPSLRVSRLALARPGSPDTVMTAESLAVRLSLPALLRGRVVPASLALAHARIVRRGGAAADPDTLAPERTGGADRVTADRVRSAARELVRTLLLPARTLPELDLRDVTLGRRGGEEEEGAALRLDRLHLAHAGAAARIEAAGTLARGAADPAIPFTAEATYEADDRLSGSATFQFTDPATRRSTPLAVRIDGRVHQDRRGGRVEVREPTRVTVGEMAFTLRGRLEQAGPALHVALAADSLTDAKLERSLPPPVLGPLAEVATIGSWDYRLQLDLDCDRPDSVDFSADVIPHGLGLDPRRTRLPLLRLDQPFTAHIHLPHGRIVDRELSPANPHFRPLDRIDPFLASAVVTNEDGAFFRHRGFNTESVREAIAENLKAGAYRRGAGTITMQLARNLWLGHERTLARKGQEVVLAWTLEHLTGLSKQRLLEIYLNIIEWGPGVHGADEAAEYYFGHDAGHLTIDEALFLTVIVPSPAKWFWRVDRMGDLRPFARAQMHFIGRAMIAKGWLRADELPPPEQLVIALRGPAGDRFRSKPEELEQPHEVEASAIH